MDVKSGHRNPQTEQPNTAEQLSQPDAGQRLLPVLLRPQPQHRAALEGKEEGESGAEQGLGCACSLRKGTASRLLLSRIFPDSGQKTCPPGRSRTKPTQFSNSNFHQLFPVSQVRFSCEPTPAEGNWEQPMGNEVGQGGAGLWDLCVPALGGLIPTPQDTARCENSILTSVMSTATLLRLPLRTLGSGIATWMASAKTGVRISSQG